jgi:cell division protein FtsW (lipid II flippase)
VKGERLRLGDLHWLLIGVVTLICCLGLYNLHSSAAAHAPLLYVTQLGWLAIGVILCSAVLTVDYRITESLAYVFYGIVCLLLIAVLFQGRSAGGARRWLEFGPAGFQPSELAKLATILCLARYFSYRIDKQGYSLLDLIRPLNVSRPVGVLGAILLAWRKPFLVDPLGEAARAVHRAYIPQPPSLTTVVWFRSLLLILIILAAVFCVLWIVRTEKQHALLAPWPKGRKTRLVALTFVMGSILTGLVVAFWQTPVLRDPINYTLRWLYVAADPLGRYAELQSVLWLRVLLCFLTGLYFLAALFKLRLGENSWEDIFIAPVDLLAVPVLLVLVEPDLGTAGIVGLIGATMILVVGVRWRSLFILAAIGAVISVGAWDLVLKDYQKQRILTFMDPEHDLMGSGWHAVQSLIAVGSGQWFGKGHMEGTQSQLSFLPEQHTDFAFSVWAEEQGFIGCLFVLGLYLVLLIIAISIATDAREPYGALVATGVAALILWQALINVSMVSGAFPVVGITMPMFSYGGSSLLSVLLGISLLLNIHWRRRSY